ncbi:YciI family protein [Kribbella sp. NPDC026611]|uniref:YciI family protein n=1 Tax=Kribbella sp. NPDC026611 TaxID=3154911 RepID=UPI0033E6288A
MSTPPRPGMESLTLILLRRPATPAGLSEAETDRIQQAHLDFLDRLRADGVMGAAGPFRDHDDQVLRGLCVYRTGIDEARRHAADDPAVQAGLLEAEAITWWFRAGEVSLTGSTGTLPAADR